MFGLGEALTIGGGLLGGLLGGKDKQQSQTQTNEPWAPAQPYILDNLKREQQLQNYYQQNPFNPQQIQGYSNLFGDTQNFRDNIMPGLLGFANRGMTSNYQRSLGPGARQAQQAPQQAAFSMPRSNPMLDLNRGQNPFYQATPAPAPASTGFNLTDPENAGLLEYLRGQYAQSKQNNRANDGGA